jgi:hypothetical protein
MSRIAHEVARELDPSLSIAGIGLTRDTAESAFRQCMQEQLRQHLEEHRRSD